MLDREYIEIDLNPNFKIGKSNIDGNGVIATVQLKYGDFINVAIIGNKCTKFGAYLNHSDFPTAKTMKGGDLINKRLAAVAWLNFALKWRELRNIEDRIAALEEEIYKIGRAHV
jgi:hypothetical protein